MTPLMTIPYHHYDHTQTKLGTLRAILSVNCPKIQEGYTAGLAVHTLSSPLARALAPGFPPGRTEAGVCAQLSTQSLRHERRDDGPRCVWSVKRVLNPMLEAVGFRVASVARKITVL